MSAQQGAKLAPVIGGADMVGDLGRYPAGDPTDPFHCRTQTCNGMPRSAGNKAYVAMKVELWTCPEGVVVTNPVSDIPDARQQSHEAFTKVLRTMRCERGLGRIGKCLPKHDRLEVGGMRWMPQTLDQLLPKAEGKARHDIVWREGGIAPPSTFLLRDSRFYILLGSRGQSMICIKLAAARTRHAIASCHPRGAVRTPVVL